MINLEKYAALVRWGTSTWTFQEWAGIVYHKPYTQKTIKAESLAEYAAFPSFSTVGVDHTFYAPPNPFVLAEYAKYLPAGFKCVSKVWEEITVPQWGRHPRYGKKAGQQNPNFLNAEKFMAEVLAVYEKAFKDHTGPFVFEFGEMYPPAIPSLQFFLEKLDDFLTKLPEGHQYAVEIRNRGFLQPEYFTMLRRHKASPVFNHWTKAPRLREQMLAAGDTPRAAEFAVVRLLTPRGIKYGAAQELYAPYNSLKARNPEMRDDVEALIEEAIAFGIPIYILVNNKAEGCAPLTIQEMDERLREKLKESDL
jgi:uncharacterized protein YecE (DUF72 family)